MGVWLVEWFVATGLALIAVPFGAALLYGLEVASVLLLGPFVMVFIFSFGFCSLASRLRHAAAFMWATRVPPAMALVVCSYLRAPILVIPATVVGLVSCYCWAESDRVIRELNTPEPK